MGEPLNTEKKRNPNGTFAEGTAPGPGRPKGQTLKEFWRERFAKMSEEERIEFTKKVGNDTIWRMAEGNPQSDVTSGGEKIQQVPIYASKSLHRHSSNAKDIQSPKED